jgi:signal transduction histidine kinase
MADGVVVVSLDGIIRFANPAAEQLFGRSADQLHGSDLGIPALSGETTEVEVQRPSGVPVTAELRVVDSDWEGEPARLISLRDVTDRKQLEREREARARAEAASKAKSDFLAIMSHELRTPLNAVIGYADLLDVGTAGPVTGDQRAHLARIRASGLHLLDLVNEMLDLARVGAGRLALVSGAASAVQTATAALALVSLGAEARGVAISEQCGGGIRASYRGDPDRVRQILGNLLDNAVKFTQPGGQVRIECGVSATPEAEARLDGAGPWVYWRVEDTGIGIPPRQLTSIFEPFVQVEAGHTRSADGSGLGLTISRSLARLMKGDITVRSAVMAGSCFTLWLPAASAPRVEPEPPRA